MVREITDEGEWDRLVLENRGHPLQLWGWGEVKAAHGWEVKRLELATGKWAGAQVLLRQLPRPFGTFSYVPRGPVGKWRKDELDELATYCREKFNAVTVSIEPDTEKLTVVPGWKRADNKILLPKTLILDLTKSEEDLQNAMAKKTRQYIRKSANDGVKVREARSTGDITDCLAIYKETAIRAGFDLHSDAYYRDIVKFLGKHSRIFVAEYNREVVAFLWLVTSNTTAFELYGGVNDIGQQTKANYVLKWHAIMTFKNELIERYDMNGLLNDGVSGFKKSFASHENMLVGTLDKPLSPLYAVWSKGLPLAKKVVRTAKSIRK